LPDFATGAKPTIQTLMCGLFDAIGKRRRCG
jgi:hypothetical protein